MGSHVPFVHDGCLGMGLALKNGENGKTCLQEDFLYELLDFPLLTLRAGLLVYGKDVVFTVYSFTYYLALSLSLSFDQVSPVPFSACRIYFQIGSNQIDGNVYLYT